jgi:hypothetical protein
VNAGSGVWQAEQLQKEGQVRGDISERGERGGREKGEGIRGIAGK